MKHHRSVTPSQIRVSIVDVTDQPFNRLYREAEPRDDCPPYLIKISNHLYIGTAEAAYSEPLLCRFNINSLVKISCLQPNQVARERKSFCPCACPLTTAHSRATLNVYVSKDKDEDVIPYLKDINIFIRRHRELGRNVLVQSDDGLNRAPTIIAQYLVQVCNESLDTVISYMKYLRPEISIRPHFYMILRKIERKSSRTFIQAIPPCAGDLRLHAVRKSNILENLHWRPKWANCFWFRRN